MNEAENLQNTTETAVTYEPMLGNVLIAKYLGSKFINDAPEVYPNGYYYQPEDLDDDCPTGEPNDWLFDKSWDWIMPVVEKINKRDWVTIYNDECKIHALVSGEFETIDIINEEQPLIKSVFEAVVKYAEWYLLNIA